MCVCVCDAGAQEKPYYSDYSPLRRTIHTVCTSHYLDLFITIIIFTNLLTMSMEHYNQPKVTIATTCPRTIVMKRYLRWCMHLMLKCVSVPGSISWRYSSTAITSSPWSSSSRPFSNSSLLAFAAFSKRGIHALMRRHSHSKHARVVRP